MSKNKNVIVQQKILELLKDFCDKKLDQEYLELSNKLTIKLSREYDLILESSKPAVWAAAIIHALGTINFLFDKSFEPFVTVDEINLFFGTSKSTTGNKSREIRNKLNLDYCNQEFSIRSMLENNPYEKYIMVNGFIVPRDLTELEPSSNEPKPSQNMINKETPTKPQKVIPVDDSLGLFD